jgi:hypothetical protein
MVLLLLCWAVQDDRAQQTTGSFTLNDQFQYRQKVRRPNQNCYANFTKIGHA